MTQGYGEKMKATTKADSGPYDNDVAEDQIKGEDVASSINDLEAPPDETLLDSVNFGKNIKILLVRAPHLRVICYFLGVDSVSKLKVAPKGFLVLPGLIVMSAVHDYMTKLGYKFSGELNFDYDSGTIIPVNKTTWNIKNKGYEFTDTGCLFYESPTGKKEDNVVFSTSLAKGAKIQCFAQDIQKAANLLNNLDLYAKKHNALRGAKIRDINLLKGTFSEIQLADNCTWDKFYYPDSIKSLMELEVFGFLKNPERYNSRGINRRGIMFHGPPGTGKTSLGYLLCNYAPDHTVIWITPDMLQENDLDYQSIKLLYKMADYLNPGVIILEDIDLFAEDREGKSDQLRVGGLMNLLDGANSVNNSITLATTNRLGIVESALKNRPGRFDKVVEVPVLDKVRARKMAVDRLEDCTFDDSHIDYIVKHTDRWTGAEMEELIKSLNMWFISHDLDGSKEDREVTIDNIKEVLSTMAKFSVDEKEKTHHKSPTAGVGFAGEQK